MALLGLLMGCGSTVPGHPVAQTSASRHVASPLGRMLPGQNQFPGGYVTTVLPGGQAGRTAADLSGIPAGARTDPADCGEPQPSGPDSAAVVVGSNDSTRATITVELTRTPQSLTQARDRIHRCGNVRVEHGPLTKTIATQLDPPPPANADDTLALHRTITGQRGGPGLVQTMHTLLAQVGDVRVNTTYMTFGLDQPDTAALDQVFTAAISNVRKG